MLSGHHVVFHQNSLKFIRSKHAVSLAHIFSLNKSLATHMVVPHPPHRVDTPPGTAPRADETLSACENAVASDGKRRLLHYKPLYPAILPLPLATVLQINFAYP
jgi:hypothetical protein